MGVWGAKIKLSCHIAKAKFFLGELSGCGLNRYPPFLYLYQSLFSEKV